MLKLNNDKTEFIVIATRQQRSQIDVVPHININEIDIAPTSTIRNLGEMFDSEMSMKSNQQVSSPSVEELKSNETFSGYGGSKYSCSSIC